MELKACLKLIIQLFLEMSLYNETNGQSIYPTPVIGGVGLIKIKYAKGFKIEDNSNIYLVGKTRGHLESSYFMNI